MIPRRFAIPVGVSRVHILASFAFAIVLSLTPIAGANADENVETRALAFVRENHPELATLLAQLKPMKPEEYEKAVKELAQVSKTLATLKVNNPRRYAAALETWKARSRVQLIAARLSNANSSKTGAAAELESQLRQAVEAQVDTEIRQAKVDKEAAEERVRRLTENLSRLEGRRDVAVQTRIQSLLKQSRRAQRSSAKADSKNSTNTNAIEPATRKKEPRP